MAQVFASTRKTSSKAKGYLRKGMAAMNRATNNQLSIFTDGSCLGNPGPGGYGIVLKYNGHCRELSGGFRKTTNNRMELLAAIKGLAALKRPCAVILYSDSKYVVDAMTKGWSTAWRAKGWRRSRNQPVANADLWQKLLGLCEKHQVIFRWVKGHSGHPENERCDQLAFAAAESSPTMVDTGYENQSVESHNNPIGSSSALTGQPHAGALDWSQRLMSVEETARYDLRLAELTTTPLKGKLIRFLCPILMREEESILCPSPITPKSIGCNRTVLQRQDVDSFFRSLVEYDFGYGVNIRGLSFSDAIKYMIGKHPSSRLKWLIRGESDDQSQLKPQEVDEERIPVCRHPSIGRSRFELSLSYDLRYSTLLSCLHSIHIGQFRSLGYRYVNGKAGRFIARLLADVFETFNGERKDEHLDSKLEGLCFTHRNMVRPVIGDPTQFDQRLLEKPYEWCIAAWDGDVLFATIHFLRTGNQLNAVMVYNLEPNAVLSTTALVISQRPLSFATSIGWLRGRHIEVGPPGERISWPCGVESDNLKPYPIRRAVNDITRHLEGMPSSYTIF